MFHGAQVSKNPAPSGGEPGLRRDRHRQGPALRGGRPGTQRGAGAFVRRLHPRSGGDGGVVGGVRGDEGRDGVDLGLLDRGLRDAGARGLRGDAGSAAHGEADRRAQERRAGLPVDLAAAQDDGRRPHRDPHRRSRYRPGDRLGDRPGLLNLPLRSALLLLACARAGNQDQRRQEPPRQVPEGGQPRRAGPAHGGYGRAPQRDLHRRQAPGPARSHGHSRRDQGDRPRPRLPDLPDGDRRPGLRRAGDRRLREAAPQQEVRSSRPPSSKARPPTRPGTAKPPNAKPNLLIRDTPP